MPAITLCAPTKAIRASIVLPGSKSVANRALVLAALAGKGAEVKGITDAADSTLLEALLRERPTTMHCGLGGTTLRFALAWAAVQQGEERTVTGEPGLLQRPHDPLVQSLRELGAQIEATGKGYVVQGRQLRGGEIHFEAALSSQYLSALMLVAPTMAQGLTIHWTGRQLSWPYVEMTARLMQYFGAKVTVGATTIRVERGHYQATAFNVPADWSAAAFWFAIVALSSDGEVLLTGLTDDGLQGDARARELFAPWVDSRPTDQGLLLRHQPHARGGSLQFDLTDTPDLFQPLAFVCGGLGVEATFTGVDNLPLKESDRLATTREALAAFGIPATITSGVFHLPGGHIPQRPTSLLATHGDHRLAMALAPLALLAGPLPIDDPGVVGKSYGGFWDDLRQAGFGIEVV